MKNSEIWRKRILKLVDAQNETEDNVKKTRISLLIIELKDRLYKIGLKIFNTKT